jgi:hypothetical protein
MKSNIFITLGMLILLGVIVTAFGIWYLSSTTEFSRKDQAAPEKREP